MTNQEAISVLESINAKTDYFLINDDARAEAIEIAISALQAQDVPGTNDGDLISRRAAIEAAIKATDDWDGGYNITRANMIEKELNDLPSAEPEPEIHWGYTPTYERPLADREIVSRLRTIQMQVGGSYAIDRAIEIIEAVAERITE